MFLYIFIVPPYIHKRDKTMQAARTEFYPRKYFELPSFLTLGLATASKILERLRVNRGATNKRRSLSQNRINSSFLPWYYRGAALVGSHDKHTRAADVTQDFRAISRGRRDRSTFHPRDDPLPLVRPRIGFRAQNAVHETRDTVIDRPSRYFRHAVYSPTIPRGSLGSGQVQERGRAIRFFAH